MGEPYLIAHKVRGEVAFDVAEKLRCLTCAGEIERIKCDECDGDGYWWICSTSGHRAYPYWNRPLTALGAGWDYPLIADEFGIQESIVDPMPEGWPDHYPCNPSPKAEGGLLHRLNLLRKLVPIKRRL